MSPPRKTGAGVAGFLAVNLTQLCGRDPADCPPGKRTGDPISPRRTGFTSEALQHLTAVQVDQSGHVWVANTWTTGSSLQEFVGGNGRIEQVRRGLAAGPGQVQVVGRLLAGAAGEGSDRNDDRQPGHQRRPRR